MSKKLKSLTTNDNEQLYTIKLNNLEHWFQIGDAHTPGVCDGSLFVQSMIELESMI